MVRALGALRTRRPSRLCAGGIALPLWAAEGCRVCRTHILCDGQACYPCHEVIRIPGIGGRVCTVLSVYACLQYARCAGQHEIGWDWFAGIATFASSVAQRTRAGSIPLGEHQLLRSD